MKLDGEQLTISAREDAEPEVKETAKPTKKDAREFSFADGSSSSSTPQKLSKPIALKKKVMSGEVPEIPMPERGATLGIYPLAFLPSTH